MSEEKRRVSDYIGCPYAPVEERKVEDVQGQELEILDFEVRAGGFGPEAHVHCEDDNGTFCVRTTSTVVISQLERLGDKLPLLGAFCREKNYHTLR